MQTECARQEVEISFLNKIFSPLLYEKIYSYLFTHASDKTSIPDKCYTLIMMKKHSIKFTSCFTAIAIFTLCNTKSENG